MNINATLIGQTVAFIIFVWFCMKFVWPPLMNAIEERQKKIADGLADADRAVKDLELAQAKAKKKKVRTVTFEEIEAERNRVKEDLRKQVASLAIAGAEKILERSIDEAAHSDIVNKLVAEI